jgi:outer membrane biosynthesis protein TonB
MMIASCKRFDGWALGSNKFGKSSGEREGKFGNVPVPPQPTPKDKFAPKPNLLLKPRGKPSEKPSEKPCEEPHPKPKPRPVRFHCEFCGKDGHKREFCYKRRREARMAKEWANKDMYHPSHGVPEPRMPLPKGKGVVHTVPAWRDQGASGGDKFVGGGPLARPVRVTGQTGARQSAGEFGFHGRDARGSALSVME